MNKAPVKAAEAAGIEEKIHQQICRYAMLPVGSCVVVGFSGGADSTCLLHFLWNHREDYGISLLPLHVNHLLRGEESFRDQRFAEDFCSRLGLPLRIVAEDVGRLAREKGMSLEECGRIVRYTAFRQAAGETGKIATAHTASDLTETVLFHLAKGTGTQGLIGIPAVRGNILRPLLGISRQEVEQYCRCYGLDFVTDSTNALPEYDRNRLRLEAVPVLRALNPRLEESVFRMSLHLAQDQQFLIYLAEKALANARLPYGWSRLKLAEELEPVLSRVVSLLFKGEEGVRLDAWHIEKAIACIRGEGAVDVPGNRRLVAKGNRVFVEVSRKKQIPGEGNSCWEAPLRQGKAVLPDGTQVVLEEAGHKNPNSAGKINNLLFNNRDLYDTIRCNGILRYRRQGDFFRPPGRGVTKPLGKFFGEQGIPPEERDTRLLLAEKGSSQILWIQGIGPCDALSKGKETEAISVWITQKPAES